MITARHAWWLRSWLRPHLSVLAVALLQAGSLATALSRGLDYVRDPTVGPALSVVEKAAPLDVWGVGFTVAALVGFVGMACRRLPVAALAHAMLGGLYVAIGVGAIAAALEQGSGWRTGVGLAFAGTLHLVLAEASMDAWRDARA